MTVFIKLFVICFVICIVVWRVLFKQTIKDVLNWSLGELFIQVTFMACSSGLVASFTTLIWTYLK